MPPELLSTGRPSDRALLATMFRRAAGFVPSGVAILSTPDVAMTVSSLHCVSFDPPLVSVALRKDSRKAQAILASGRFRVRLLHSGEEELAKGEGIPRGLGMVEMECTVEARYPVGDHDLMVASVGSVRISDSSYPMIYWRRGLHGFRPRYDFVASREAFQEFVDEWEAGTLPKSRWTHTAHVAIGAYYAVRYPGEAFERIKKGIIRYNEAVGTENSDTSGYHETLTRLWANVLAKFAAGSADPWKASCEAVARFGEDRDLHHLYYSFDVVRSTIARRTWIPPDLEGPI
jgi:flavin reductase (DIM6/NTAB) family NADH-FMN oxidoreductase RutF